jgi:AcrR family transcriptional regulator
MASKESIREAAYELFASKGFNEATTENIARAAGLQKQSLYSHYSSKNDIFANVVREQAAYIVNEIDGEIQKLKDMPMETLLKGIFTKLVRVFADRTRLLFWRRIYVDLGDPEFASLLDDAELPFDEKLSESLRQLAKEKNVEIDDARFQDFLGLFFLTIQGYHDWMLIDVGLAGRVETIWPFLWNGMKSCFERE